MGAVNRDNWFLVVPTLVLGVVALYTLHSMYAAGDVRRAVEIVAEYRAGERPPLGDWLAQRSASMQWNAEVVSRFYGTLEVSCRTAGDDYRWRVDTLQRAFAPADETTRALMRQYDPDAFRRTEPR